mgnify:CR=1 FL=1|tara:strand:- start:554 stop:820 length:267 start_codon:yes stop_codon:yes gene_type:complete
MLSQAIKTMSIYTDVTMEEDPKILIPDTAEKLKDFNYHGIDYYHDETGEVTQVKNLILIQVHGCLEPVAIWCPKYLSFTRLDEGYEEE